MKRDPATDILVAHVQPERIIITVLILAVLIVALYFYLGRVTIVLWVLAAVVVIVFVQGVRQMFDRGPCIVLNDEGIYDKRLGMGLIRWSDIERVRMQGLSGAYYISLELSNSDQYLSRQPAYTRIANQIWRLYNISPIHIKVAHMDVAPGDVFELIMSRVELNRSRR